jgi:hypothetical protein
MPSAAPGPKMGDHVPPLPSQAFSAVHSAAVAASASGRPQMHGSGFALPQGKGVPAPVSAATPPHPTSDATPPASAISCSLLCQFMSPADHNKNENGNGKNRNGNGVTPP